MNKTKSSISSLGTVRTFFKVGTCSETLCSVLDRAYEHPLTVEEHAAMPLAGGIAGQGYQCGQLWGAALAAGAQAYRLLGPGPQAEAAAVLAAQQLIDSFRASNKEINCLEITEISMKSATTKQVLKLFLKGGPIFCFGMAARFANAAFPEINTALANMVSAPLSRPVSCAAMLAQKMGLSDLQIVMAAGLAGGIGLSGGACGALGAAIWIMGLEQSKAGLKIEYQSQKTTDVIEKFLESADYEFECSKIVGRKFPDVQDHASYLCGGGCAKIIEGLAAQHPI